jgi:hypothetical protein
MAANAEVGTTQLSGLVGAIAAGLQVDASRFAVVETREEKRFVVIDVLRAGSPAPMELAQQLAKSARSGASGMAAHAPVLRIREDGSAEILDVPAGLGGFTFLVGAAVVTILIWALLRSRASSSAIDPTAASSRDPKKRGKGYSKVHGMADALDDEEEDMDGNLLGPA